MTNPYVKANPITVLNYDFSCWEWGDDFEDIAKKANENTAEIVASEIFKHMTLYIETSGDLIGQAVITTYAVDDAFFSFDLVQAVSGAVKVIEDNYRSNHSKEQKAEMRNHLRAFRAKLVTLVNVVDASIDSRKVTKDDDPNGGYVTFDSLTKSLEALKAGWEG